MAQLTINTGTSAGAGDGDTLYTAFNKVNTNFTELYSKVTVLENGTIAVQGAVKGTVVGDDSTILVDGVSSSINLDGTVKGNIIPDTDEAYDLGSSSKKFKDLYLKGTTINLGTQTISATGSGITTSGTLTATAVTTTAPSTLSGTFTGDVTGSVFADDSGTLIDGVAGKIVGPVENASVTTSVVETGSITNTTQPQMSITSIDGALILSNTNLGNPGAGVGSDIEITSMSNAVAIRGEAYVSVTSGPMGGPYADLDIYGGPITLHGDVLFGSGATIDFGNATISGTNFLTSYTETDPVVGAITGIVKADGAGNISAAVAGTDYTAGSPATDIIPANANVNLGDGNTYQFRNIYAGYDIHVQPLGLANARSNLQQDNLIFRNSTYGGKVEFENYGVVNGAVYSQLRTPFGDNYIVASGPNKDHVLVTHNGTSYVEGLRLNSDGSVSIATSLILDSGVEEKYQSLADATGTVTHDCSSGHVFYHTSPDANWTVNLTNLNLDSGYATSVTLVIVQSATAYYPSALQIGGSAQTIYWQGGSAPSSLTADGIDVATFSIINNGGTYTVLGQVTGFDN